MKAFIVLCCLISASCQSSKKNVPATVKNNLPDSSIKTNVPACIDSLVKVFKKEERTNPPRKIYRYSYRDKTVYYVPAQCCDFFSELYDDNCTLIGHPDGGFTGKGDGMMTDFFEARKNETLIWQDERANNKQGKTL